MLWNFPAVTTSGCPGSNSEMKFKVWYTKFFFFIFFHSSCLKYSYTVYEEPDSHITQFKGRSMNRGQLNLHFHLLQVLLVFFIIVYGKIPNLMIAVVFFGFIKWFVMVLQKYLDVSLKSKSDPLVESGQTHCKRLLSLLSHHMRWKKMRPETCFRSSKWASNLSLELESLSVLLFTGLHHLLFSYYKVIMLAPGLLGLEILPQDIWWW